MPAPSDINDHIAKAKGWEWIPREPVIDSDWGRLDLSLLSPDVGEWRKPEGEPAMRPDFVGTLEGVSGMLQELQDREDATSHDWLLRWSTFLQVWDFWKEDENTHERLAEFLARKEEGFGVAVGRAYLSMKEAGDEN